ncbi:MAG: hypothetical protein M1816_003091 [Peltula sp. TS41687]|nr:MAG: hypothetical protein M1816_003091 [Peltula sp. TS41687]
MNRISALQRLRTPFHQFRITTYHTSRRSTPSHLRKAAPSKSARRNYSTSTSTRSSSDQTKQVSPHVGFYKDFGRPIAKVFFGATFTYQVLYYVWVKLETEEIKAEKKGGDKSD